MNFLDKHAVEMARSDNLLSKILGQLYLRVASPSHDIAVNHKGLLLVQLPTRQGEKRTNDTDVDRVQTTVIGAALMLSGLPWNSISVLVHNKPTRIPTMLETLLGEDGCRVLMFVYNAYENTRRAEPNQQPELLLLLVLRRTIQGHFEACIEVPE